MNPLLKIGTKVEYASHMGVVIAYFAITKGFPETQKFYVVNFPDGDFGHDGLDHEGDWTGEVGESLSYKFKKTKKYYYINTEYDILKIYDTPFEEKQIEDI